MVVSSAPVIVESVEVSLSAGAMIWFSAEVGKTVSFSNSSVTLTVGSEDYTGQNVEVVLAGNESPVLFKFTNNGDSMTNLSFDVE